MDAAAEKRLETLNSAGRLKDTPVSDAHAAARIWEDVRSWWHSGQIRAARQGWLDRYAVTTDKNGQRYTSTDLARLWF
mgnify:CR=1 FL=1